MSLSLIVLLLAAGLVTALCYGALGRMLPGRWRVGDEGASEEFTIDSVNVLVGLMFSILLAFVVAGVMQDFSQAGETTQHEANALGAIYGFAQGISEPSKSLWKHDARDYAALVVDQDWPLMQHQQSSQAAWAAVNTLRDHIMAFQPASPLEESLQDKAIDKVQDIYDARRTRVDLIQAGVPDLMWYGLLGGAVLVAFFPLLTKPHPSSRLLIAVAIQSMVIVAALYVVSQLNHPFSGEYRVDPDAFQILLSRFDASP